MGNSGPAEQEISFIVGAEPNGSVLKGTNVATLKFLDGKLRILLSLGTFNERMIEIEIWEHTVFELEILAEALFMSSKSEYRLGPFEGQAKLISDSIYLPLALQCDIGPVTFFCSSRSPRRRPVVVDISVLFEFSCSYGTFSRDEILQFSKDLFQVTKAIAPGYVSWSEPPADPL